MNATNNLAPNWDYNVEYISYRNKFITFINYEGGRDMSNTL